MTILGKVRNYKKNLISEGERVWTKTKHFFGMLGACFKKTNYVENVKQITIRKFWKGREHSECFKPCERICMPCLVLKRQLSSNGYYLQWFRWLPLNDKNFQINLNFLR